MERDHGLPIQKPECPQLTAYGYVDLRRRRSARAIHVDPGRISPEHPSEPQRLAFRTSASCLDSVCHATIFQKTSHPRKLKELGRGGPPHPLPCRVLKTSLATAISSLPRGVAPALCPRFRHSKVATRDPWPVTAIRQRFGGRSAGSRARTRNGREKGAVGKTMPMSRPATDSYSRRGAGAVFATETTAWTPYPDLRCGRWLAAH